MRAMPQEAPLMQETETAPETRPAEQSRDLKTLLRWISAVLIDGAETEADRRERDRYVFIRPR